MTNQEQDIKIERTSQQVDDFKSIIENFIGEMRDRDNQRAAEIREINRRIDEKLDNIDKKFDKIDEKFDKFDEKIEKFGAQIQNMAIAVVVGVAAIVWAVISVVK